MSYSGEVIQMDKVNANMKSTCMLISHAFDKFEQESETKKL